MTMGSKEPFMMGERSKESDFTQTPDELIAMQDFEDPIPKHKIRKASVRPTSCTDSKIIPKNRCDMLTQADVCNVYIGLICSLLDIAIVTITPFLPNLCKLGNNKLAH